jgi:DNA-binding transcriptional MerR regulator
VTERAHLSIGEVLSLLQEEFPDVTISKIRFLESQGLLDPERTPSGYRKFYEPDIERLRWILHQQRENFLPLRVIKDRLEGRPDSEPVESDGEQAGDSGVATPETATPAVPARGRATEKPREPSPAPQPEPQPASRGARGATPPSTRAHTSPAPSALDSGPSAVSLTRDELASATGLPDKIITELERYGLVTGRPMGRDTLYDEEALVVARLAAGFLRYGVEARHLRMYKVAAEREASFFEQVVLPLVKQRNPAARRQAVDNLAELASLGESLRGAMLRHALKSYSL